MKSLNKLSNTQRGKMLVDLHPRKRAEIVDAIEKIASEIIENKQEHRQNWKETFMTFDFWFSQVAEVSELIKTNGAALRRSNTIFSDQLFFGYRAIFSNPCICEMAKNQNEQPEFCLTVALLYFYPNQYKLILKSNGNY